MDGSVCRCCFPSYMPHNTGSFLGGGEGRDLRNLHRGCEDFIEFN